jgi:hypothetical protein
MSVSKKSLILLGVLVAWGLVMAVTMVGRHRQTTYAAWLERYKSPNGRATNSTNTTFNFIEGDDRVAIRKDFIHMLDVMQRARVGFQAKRPGVSVPHSLTMVWSEGDVLYIQNPACYLEVSPESEVETWSSWLGKAKARETMPINDKAYYNFAMINFDQLVIKGSSPVTNASRFPDTTLKLEYGDERDQLRRK